MAIQIRVKKAKEALIQAGLSNSPKKVAEATGVIRSTIIKPRETPIEKGDALDLRGYQMRKLGNARVTNVKEVKINGTVSIVKDGDTIPVAFIDKLANQLGYKDGGSMIESYKKLDKAWLIEWMPETIALKWSIVKNEKDKSILLHFADGSQEAAIVNILLPNSTLKKDWLLLHDGMGLMGEKTWGRLTTAKNEIETAIINHYAALNIEINWVGWNSKWFVE